MASKERIDNLLVKRGLCDSREKAKRLIMAGEVRSNTTIISKPSTKIDSEAPLEIKTKEKYVSRGGHKLEGALEEFNVSAENKVCLDVGSSTGGFTDCLLQRGALRVHAIDVGTNQLVWKLRNDERVIVKEQFNARYLEPKDLGEPIDLMVTDVSFISLTKILPASIACMKPGGEMVCLIKPQFELEREDVPKGGVIKSEELRMRAVEKIRAFIEGSDSVTWNGFAPSKIAGMEGNQEYLAHLTIDS